MWPFKRAKFRYTPLEESDNGTEVDLQNEIEDKKQQERRWGRILSLVSICALFVIVGFHQGKFVRDIRTVLKLQASKPLSKCLNPSTRREWRSLSTAEKHEYINAVRCLLECPSRLNGNTTLYNDFPDLHDQYGKLSHMTAAFLPWHRYFIHIYENELSRTCGYTGSLPYWDWSLDWEDLPSSPVFSNIAGFGGNGNPNASQSVGLGHCVTEGPFSNLTLLYFGPYEFPHCLSRSFQDRNVDGQLSGDKLQPSMVRGMLGQPDFESFLDKIETSHEAIPNGIRGDFLRFTSPNDPLFFLHHTQVDRLWWLWQQKDLLIRKSEYTGRVGGGSEDGASLDDLLPMGGFAPDIQVSEMMTTESGFLCYRY